MLPDTGGVEVTELVYLGSAEETVVDVAELGAAHHVVHARRHHGLVEGSAVTHADGYRWYLGANPPSLEDDEEVRGVRPLR